MKTRIPQNLAGRMHHSAVAGPGRFYRHAHAGAGILILMATMAVRAADSPAQNTNQPPANTPDIMVVTNAPASDAQTPTAPPPPESAAAMATTNALTASTEAAVASGSSTNGLILNFRNAPIDLVLKYLSDAAGFIIEMDTPVRGNVSVISSHSMTKDEAVNLLNTVLNQNGYAAVRSGDRTLRIMDKSTAKSSNIPVITSNNPDSVPNNDEMVTQIIPIRFVEAQQLVSDLSPFVSQQATIIANQAANSIVITDTQANIRHLMEIIKAIDNSAEDVTEVRVFKLQYADPTEMANLLTSLFPDQTSGAQAPFRFGGRGGRGGFRGPGAFFAAMAANSGNQNSQQDRIKKRNQVVAVADPRSSSVVVTATSDLMDQISQMIAQLDNPSAKSQRVAVIPVHSGDPYTILQSLQDTFGSSNTRNNRNTSTQTDPFQYRVQQYLNNNSTIGSGSSSTGGRRTSGGGVGGVSF